MYSGKLRLENGEEYDVTADGVLYNNNRLDQELDGMKEDIETIDGKADTNATNISALSSRVGDVESDVSDLETVTSGHTTAISGLNTTVEQHTTDISGVAQSLSAHSSGKINTENGEHGIRYYNDKLSYKDSNDNWQDIETGGGGGGTTDYQDLTNKPSINGVELLGNKVIGLLSTNIQVDSDKIGYDNLTSGLSATNVKSALDELKSDIDNIQVTPDADDVGYDNTTSQMTATDVQGAIDELKSDIDSKGTASMNATSGQSNQYTIADGQTSSNFYNKAGVDNVLGNYQPKVTASTTDLTPSVSSLATGNLYVVYEA